MAVQGNVEELIRATATINIRKQQIDDCTTRIDQLNSELEGTNIMEGNSRPAQNIKEGVKSILIFNNKIKVIMEKISVFADRLTSALEENSKSMLASATAQQAEELSKKGNMVQQ